MNKFFGIFLIFLLAISTNLAAKKNNYLVNNVFVEDSGDSPVEARNNAIKTAQRNAFTILLKRLSIDQRFSNDFTSEEVADAVHSQQIMQEKIAGNNYSAVFNIAFAEEFVSDILGDKNISKRATKQEIYLLFPVKLSGGKYLLWEKNNDWKVFLENYLTENPDSAVRLPKGNFDDISMMNPGIIKTADFSDFEPLLVKYGANAAMIAFFKFDKIENKVNINLKTIRKFQKKQVRLSFVNVNNLAHERLISKVAEKTVGYIAKSKPQISFVTQSDLAIDILVSDLGDWLEIKKRLEDMNFIEDFNIDSISKDVIKISLKHNAAIHDISELFANHKLFLESKGGSESRYLMSLKPL